MKQVLVFIYFTVLVCVAQLTLAHHGPHDDDEEDDHHHNLCDHNHDHESHLGNHICLDGHKHACQLNETCVTWDQDYGLLAENEFKECHEAEETEHFHECVPNSMLDGKQPILPLQPVCQENEVFVRGNLRQCDHEDHSSTSNCPPHWNFRCYPKTESTKTCENVECNTGTNSFCEMQEICTVESCTVYPSCVEIMS